MFCTKCLIVIIEFGEGCVGSTHHSEGFIYCLEWSCLDAPLGYWNSASGPLRFQESRRNHVALCGLGSSKSIYISCIFHKAWCLLVLNVTTDLPNLVGNFKFRRIFLPREFIAFDELTVHGCQFSQDWNAQHRLHIWLCLINPTDLKAGALFRSLQCSPLARFH